MLEATCGGNFRFISSTSLWKHGRKAFLINKDEGLASQFQEVPRPYILELKERILDKTIYPIIKPIIFHTTLTLGLTISVENLPLI